MVMSSQALNVSKDRDQKPFWATCASVWLPSQLLLVFRLHFLHFSFPLGLSPPERVCAFSTSSSAHFLRYWQYQHCSVSSSVWSGSTWCVLCTHSPQLLHNKLQKKGSDSCYVEELSIHRTAERKFQSSRCSKTEIQYSSGTLSKILSLF